MRMGYRFIVVAVLLAWVGVPAIAGETATLRNGYSIQFDRRELRGELTRLYLSASPDNFVDVRTDDIMGFEAEGMAPISPNRPVPRSNQLNISDMEEVVSAASTRNNISPSLIRSVISAESGFNPSAVSRKGAQGLMQLMPETAARMGVQNAFDPSENVEGGARYLHELLGLFHNDVVKALAAYNAGPQRVEQYHGVPPFPETIAYVKRVIRDFHQPIVFSQNATADPFRRQSAKGTATAPARRKTVRTANPAVASGTVPYFERYPLSSEEEVLRRRE